MSNEKSFSSTERHTKDKIAIYNEYLKRYLRIILSGGYRRVSIFDPLAGDGNSDGSAVIACNNIAQSKMEFPDKDIFLYLNELDVANHASLSDQCKHDFVKCVKNKNAKYFIEEQCKYPHTGHKLWFIDPYGYTQVGKPDISNIMNQRGSEILLFIPLTHIYRFLKGDLHDNKLKSIANFLQYYSIKELEAKKCLNPQAFANLISRAMQEIYGYSWHATTVENGNSYSLFFISKHYLGLHKFLEARDSILTDATNLQFSFIPIGNEKDVLNLIPNNSSINNCALYELGLNNGFTPPTIRGALESLEKRRFILVTDVKKGKRRKGSYYIGSEYFKKSDIRITISRQPTQGKLS